MAAAAGIDISEGNARDQFKENFYIQVFFSKVSKWNPKIKRAFKTLFPDAYSAIQHIKQSNHNQFAIQLQNLEASVIIFDVLNQLQEEGHIAISLHDAILCNNQETLKRTKELIRASLQRKHKLDITFKDELKQMKQDQVTVMNVQPVAAPVRFIDKKRAFDFLQLAEDRVLEHMVNIEVTLTTLYNNLERSLRGPYLFNDEERVVMMNYLIEYRNEKLLPMFTHLGLAM